MDLYWRIDDIPELRDLNPQLRREIWVATAGRRLRDPGLLVLLLFGAVLLGFGGAIGGVVGSWIGIAAGAFVGGTLGFVAYWLLGARRYRPLLADEVLRRTGRDVSLG